MYSFSKQFPIRPEIAATWPIPLDGLFEMILNQYIPHPCDWLPEADKEAWENLRVSRGYQLHEFPHAPKTERWEYGELLTWNGPPSITITNYTPCEVIIVNKGANDPDHKHTFRQYLSVPAAIEEIQRLFPHIPKLTSWYLTFALSLTIKEGEKLTNYSLWPIDVKANQWRGVCAPGLLTEGRHTQESYDIIHQHMEPIIGTMEEILEAWGQTKIMVPAIPCGCRETPLLIGDELDPAPNQ